MNQLRLGDYQQGQRLFEMLASVIKMTSGNIALEWPGFPLQEPVYFVFLLLIVKI